MYCNCFSHDFEFLQLVIDHSNAGIFDPILSHIFGPQPPKPTAPEIRVPTERSKITGSRLPHAATALVVDSPAGKLRYPRSHQS